MKKKELKRAFKNDIINAWEMGFVLDVLTKETLTSKQQNRLDNILEFIKNPNNEDRISDNKFARTVEILNEEDIPTSFRRDVKVRNVWFRQCELCEDYKKKETNYDSSYKKNRRSSWGGSIVYSRRCTSCESTVGHKWGSLNIKV